MSKLQKVSEKGKTIDNPELITLPAHLRKDLMAGGEEPRLADAAAHLPLRVHYCQTRVQKVSPRVFQTSKLFAFFTEEQMTDHFKILRHRILSQMDGIPGNSLLVTSCNAGEGKTFTSINLGISIAQEMNRTVLIIDADLKKPLENHLDFAADFFCIAKDKGLSDYLRGNMEIADLLINPGVERLTFLPSGRPMADSTEMLGSASMESLLAEAKSRYPDRFIIVDTPALFRCADPIVLARHVDGILMVVEGERTAAADLMQGVALLQKAPLLGVVYNRNKAQRICL